MSYGPRPADLTGSHYSKWTVIRFSHCQHGKRFYECACECGRVQKVNSHSLTSGRSKACRSCCKVGSAARMTHGLRGTPEYNSWACMKQRCTNPSNHRFQAYGGRGIRICDRWLNSFEDFFVDMGPKPSPSHSIERLDNDGDYDPANCVWATKTAQARNRRRPLAHHNNPNSLANLKPKSAEYLATVRPPKKVRTCTHCHRDFHRRGSKAKYCSASCYRSSR